GMGQGDPAERVCGATQGGFPPSITVAHITLAHTTGAHTTGAHTTGAHTTVAALLVAAGLAGHDQLGEDVFDDGVEQGVLVGGVAGDPHWVGVWGRAAPGYRLSLDTD